MITIKYQKLLDFTKNILLKINVDNFSAECVSVGLCESSLRGVDSHGINLLKHYVQSVLNGRKNPKPKFIFKSTFPAFGNLDADNGFGHAAGMKAIDYAIDIADKMGIAAVGVYNSSHPGAMASMALRAARKGFIAFAFTHADSLLLSYNGKRPYFGTNPICFAVPRKNEEPYCLDMASTIISWNKLKQYRNNNELLPDFIASDKDGNNTNNPFDARCLNPIGEYKGYGIASMVEVLCGVMTGMNFGRSIPSMYETPINETRKLGQFYMVMRTDGIINSNIFLEKMKEMSSQVRREPSNEKEKVMLPGDREILTSKERLKYGIPLNDLNLEDLKKISQTFDISLDVNR